MGILGNIVKIVTKPIKAVVEAVEEITDEL